MACRAQTNLELNLLYKETRPQIFDRYLMAANEDRDKGKEIVIRSLLGHSYIATHNYFQAEKELLKVAAECEGANLKLIRTKFGNNTIFDCYDYLAELYISTGNFRKANYYLRLSYKKKRAAINKGNPSRIVTTKLLAEYHLKKDNVDSADYYLEFLHDEMIRTRSSTSSLNELFRSYFTYKMELQIKSGNARGATHYYKELIRLNNSLPFLRNEHNHSQLLLKSKLELLKGEYVSSLKTCDDLARRLPDSLAIYPELLRVKMMSLWLQKKLDLAFSVGKDLIVTDLHNIRKIFSNLDEGEKESFALSIHSDFDMLVSLMQDATRSTNKLSFLRDLLNFRLLTKGLLLTDAKNMKNILNDNISDETRVEYETLQSLKNKVSNRFSTGDIGSIASLQDSIELLERRLSFKTNEKVHEDLVDTDRIIKVLSTKELAIEIVQFNRFGKVPSRSDRSRKLLVRTDTLQYLCFLISSDSINYTFLTNGNDLNGRMAAYFKNSITSGNTDSMLYNAYWTPLENNLQSSPEIIYLSSDGVFNRINLDLLYSNEGYLFDKYDIVQLTNLKDLVRNKSLDLKMENATAIFFGRPKFELNANDQVTETYLQRGTRSSSLSEIKEEMITDLPGTEVEVLASSKIVRDFGWKTEVILGKDAREFKLRDIKNPQILHLATHGFFLDVDSDNSPMLNTGLLFAGVKNELPNTADDGILTAYEASALKLDSTNLVVLSACETGLGELVSGEGVFGLQRAFELAGAKNIIMSLWKVDDAATQLLMTFFYEQLMISKQVRGAFKEAQRRLREIYPSPYYWGAFVVSGL